MASASEDTPHPPGETAPDPSAEVAAAAAEQRPAVSPAAGSVSTTVHADEAGDAGSVAAEREAAPTSLKAPDDAVRGISIPEMPTDALAAATESAEAAPGTDAASAQTAPPPEPTPETTEQKRARRRRMVAQSWKVSLRRAAAIPATICRHCRQAKVSGPARG